MKKKIIGVLVCMLLIATTVLPVAGTMNKNEDKSSTIDIFTGQDTTPPVTTHTITPAAPDGMNGWYVTGPTIALYATDDDSGVRYTYYSIDGAPFTLYTPGTTIGPIYECRHTFEYYSVDYAENEELPHKSFNFNVDITLPTKTFFSIPIWFIVCWGILSFGSANDACSGLDMVEWYENGAYDHTQNPTILGGFFWYRPGGPCSDIITARVYDKAGNWV